MTDEQKAHAIKIYDLCSEAEAYYRAARALSQDCFVDVMRGVTADKELSEKVNRKFMLPRHWLDLWAAGEQFDPAVSLKKQILEFVGSQLK